MYIKKFNYFPLGLGTAFCLLMLLSLLLTACSNEASQARNEANNPDTRVQFGPGIYSARITSQQIKLYSDPSITNNLAGNWKLELRHDNSYQISLNNSMVTNGNYFIKGEYLIFQTGQWPNRCVGQANTSGAVYKWTVEDKSLSLSSNEEYCDMRRFVLTTSSFVQQQA